MNLIPVLNKILIEVIPHKTQTDSGISLPQSMQPDWNEAVVLAVGPGKKDEPMPVKAGDKILCSKYSEMEIVMDGKLCRIIAPDAVSAIVT